MSKYYEVRVLIEKVKDTRVDDLEGFIELQLKEMGYDCRITSIGDDDELG